MNRNPYLLSLLYPGINRGARIPDDCTQNTTVWTSHTRRSIDSDVASSNMMIAVSPQVPDGLWGYETDGKFPTPDNSHKLPLSCTAITNAKQLYASIRLISCELQIFCLTNSANNDGFIASCIWPKGVGFPTYDTMLASENTQVGSVRNGLRMLYRPLDNDDRVFYPTDSFPPPLPDSSEVVSGITGNAFLVYMDNLNQVTGEKFLIDIICNYECTVKPSYVDLVATTPSPVNPHLVAQADAVIETLPPSTPNPTPTFGVSSASVPVGVFENSPIEWGPRIRNAANKAVEVVYDAVSENPEIIGNLMGYSVPKMSKSAPSSRKKRVY